jgi:hypothetical protein
LRETDLYDYQRQLDKIDEAELECTVERASTLVRPHNASVV